MKCAILYLVSIVFYFSLADSSSEQLKRVKRRTTCTPQYQTLHWCHTMCLYDKGRVKSVGTGESYVIVNRHNALRSQVSPSAKNMQKMVWDDELAAIAGKWAAQCTLSSEIESSRRTSLNLPGLTIGQNVGRGSPMTSFEAIIDQWLNERQHFVYGQGSRYRRPTSHYTQMVQGSATRVGCGKASCADGYTYFVCNYAGETSGLVNTKIKPYDACFLPRCGVCGGKPLCDCGGVVCLNDGRLDAASCTCSCRSGFYGRQCELVDCSTATDKWFCPGKEHSCATIPYFAHNCPFTCKVCNKGTPYLQCATKCQNGGIEQHDCSCKCPKSYTGRYCEVRVSCKEQYFCPASKHLCTRGTFNRLCPVTCGLC